MQKLIQKFSFTLLIAVLMAPVSLLAQKEEDKQAKEKKEAEQIIITRKGDRDEKIIVEVTADKVIVNGKEVKGNDGEVTVRRNKIKDVWAYGGSNVNVNSFGNFNAFSTDENRAMLGVTTEKVDQGAVIEDITKESAAEKAGLKKGDIITKINETKIETPDDLSATIKKQKPGEKISVTYLRDKKEAKVSAELTKWKGVSIISGAPGKGFNIDLGNLENLDMYMPRTPPTPRTPYSPYSQNWSRAGSNNLKLGLSVQDSEDGKGVKVLEVDDEGSAAKAGIKEDDVITEVDGKAVNGADEIAKLVKESKEKVSVKMKLLRKGKTEEVEVRIPRKLKTADL